LAKTYDFGALALSMLMVSLRLDRAYRLNKSTGAQSGKGIFTGVDKRGWLW